MNETLGGPVIFVFCQGQPTGKEGPNATGVVARGIIQGTVLSNETIFSLTDLSTTFLVNGAGPISVKMVQAFQRLGSHV